MTYTDEQLERAARRLCEMRGKDPELLLEWMVDELRAHLEREQALMDVLLESTNEWINNAADAGEEK